MDFFLSNIIKSNTFALIATFLYQGYKVNPQSTVPYQQLIQSLGDFLEEINYAKKMKNSGQEE
jgi:hypothetical protein